jgi:ParB-like chromosome segregation protein Spo0J
MTAQQDLEDILVRLRLGEDRLSGYGYDMSRVSALLEQSDVEIRNGILDVDLVLENARQENLQATVKYDERSELFKKQFKLIEAKLSEPASGNN